MKLRTTERIWLRAFGTPPKSSLTAGLQIRSERWARTPSKKKNRRKTTMDKRIPVSISFNYKSHDFFLPHMNILKEVEIKRGSYGQGF